MRNGRQSQVQEHWYWGSVQETGSQYQSTGFQFTSPGPRTTGTEAQCRVLVLIIRVLGLSRRSPWCILESTIFRSPCLKGKPGAGIPGPGGDLMPGSWDRVSFSNTVVGGA